MSHDNDVTNLSGNRPFEEVVQVYATRRRLLQGSLAFAATSFFGSAALAARGGKKGPNGPVGKFKDGLSDFTPVSVASVNASDGKLPIISEDYEYQVLIPWGTPLKSGIPAYEGDPGTRPNPADQANMIGIGHDGMHFFPLGNGRGLLAINHEFGNNTHVIHARNLVQVDRGDRDDNNNIEPVDLPANLGAVMLSQHAHGVAVVEIVRVNGAWDVVLDSPYNRRIHPNTPVNYSGPVAGTDLINSPIPTLGTVNNCSNGHTPWGTYLTCEENFNGYFGDSTAVLVGEDWVGSWSPTPEQERYGFSTRGFDYGWEQYATNMVEGRFDLSGDYSLQETNRYGWVVEIDPMDPAAPPVKRTALGRFKHEGVAFTVGRGGRAVAYMGDDQRFDYIYKFVSDGNWRAMRAQGMSPLDHGALYVAKFNDDGTGDWLELTIDNPALAARFSSQAEVLTYARAAADILGATPMDRPEWTTVAPNGDVYCTLTNNSRRSSPDPANPLVPNPDGHIVRWHDSDQHTGLTFTWDIYVIAANTHGTESSFSDPDGLAVDPDGRIFVETDGGQKDGLQNQLLVGSIFDDAETPRFKRLFSGVNSDEITGLTTTADRETLFINTQHPGNGDPSRTNFPAPPDGVTIPRDSTFVITRKGGGVIGS